MKIHLHYDTFNVLKLSPILVLTLFIDVSAGATLMLTKIFTEIFQAAQSIKISRENLIQEYLIH